MHEPLFPFITNEVRGAEFLVYFRSIIENLNLPYYYLDLGLTRKSFNFRLDQALQGRIGCF